MMIQIQQSITNSGVLPPFVIPPIVIPVRRHWVPKETDLGVIGTPADGVKTQFNAPADWDLSQVNGTKGEAGTGNSTFYYTDVLPLNPNSATFTVMRSEASPTGKVAIFSQPPTPFYDETTGEPVPTSVNFLYYNYEVIV